MTNRAERSGQLQIGLWVIVFIWPLLLTGCAGQLDPHWSTAPGDDVSVAVHTESSVSNGDTPVLVRTVSMPYAPAAPCTGQFVAHDLPFTTTVAREPVEMFDSNGAGLAVNDLDNDGDLDLLFANLNGNNAILWNDGDLHFRPQELPFGNARMAAIVDVDGDNWQDLIFTTRTGSLLQWRNQGATEPGAFMLTPLAGVRAPAYAMNWADADQDGDLDLVTGSYDAGLEKELGDTFMLGGGAGVYYYDHAGDRFVPQRLADTAQALTILFFDVNRDGRADILVGNDFVVQDAVWLATADGWQTATPFSTTTHSTMSLAAGDLNNDGLFELFATDMHPYGDDAATLAAWQPVMDMMTHSDLPDDPQVMENVLQVAAADSYANQAAARGVMATGWSWSAKFGDLDNDGWLDLYVVNGMAANELFGQLPGGQLVEENQAFRNDGRGGFVPMPDWLLNAETGGRGMSMADVDRDGDLDIVVNNLLTPAQLFENRLCVGPSIQLDLAWPGRGNSRAIGARIAVHTTAGTIVRTVDAASGYLSGDAARVHVGLPAAGDIQRIDITWPDGVVSTSGPVAANHFLLITREQ